MVLDESQKRQWLYELRLNGFILLRDFLDRDFVDALSEQMRPLVAGHAKRVEEGDASVVRGRNRVSIDLRPYANVLGGSLVDERLRRHPIIVEILDAVLGSWREGSLFAECPLPGSEYMTWHPDTDDAFLSQPLRPVRMTFNVPLADVEETNGPMEIVPGSHRLHHHDVARIYGLPQVYSVRLLTRKGDCILRDGNALHRGTPNLSSSPRVMLGQTYRRVDRDAGAADAATEYGGTEAPR